MKTICIHHSIDLDGWMSAAIVKHWFIENSKFINGVRDESIGQELDFIDYNYGQPIPDLSSYDRVIMCDISFPKEVMAELYDSGKLTWIDHHISAIKDYATMDRPFPKGLQDINYAACELTWKFFFTDSEMPEIVHLLGRYDCFGHKGTSEERKVMEFQYGARACISNYDEAYKYLDAELSDTLVMGTNYSYNKTIQNNGIAIYQSMIMDAKQAYKNGFHIMLTEEVKPGVGTVHPFICINKERFNPGNFDIDYHKDGYHGVASFYYAKGKWNFSLYSDTVDCSVIAKHFGGGGHAGASGFMLDDISTIIPVK